VTTSEQKAEKAELVRATAELAAAKAAQRAANRAVWAKANETAAARLAAERQAAREERRAANSAAWQAARETERAASLEAAAARRAAKSEQWAGRQLPINDPHVVAMAERLGKTPAEFLDWQREQQERLAKVEPISTQMAKLRSET